MKQLQLLMGMPITVEIVDPGVTEAGIEQVFAYFRTVDETFSTYKEHSEISKINRGELAEAEYSEDMKTILTLSEQTRQETNGYFNIRHKGKLDPSGIVKGWAILQAAKLLKDAGWRNFYIDAGGDIQMAGYKDGKPWRVGIRNPFNRDEIVKVLQLTDRGVATSGTAIRGQHIYNPHRPRTPLRDIMSLTVIGPDIYEADRFATAAFAMGKEGIFFIEQLPGFEGYMIDASACATFTTGFKGTSFKMIARIDDFLDRITMYRLVLYILIIYIACAAVLSYFGLLPFSPGALLLSTAFLVLMCWATNTLIAYILAVPTNIESTYITALILALIISPIATSNDFLFLGWATILAISSKYVLSLYNKHIFNPAAVAIVITSFALGESASWWVGTASMLPVILLGGLLVIRKLRQGEILTFFLMTSLFTVCVVSLLQGLPLLKELQQLVIMSPLFFFATIMFTEPLTAPPTQKLRYIYAGIVGIFFVPQIHVGSIYSTPELALVVGNLYSYAVSPKHKVILKLKRKKKIAFSMMDFAFQPSHKLAFVPGQYLEVTLAHAKPDSRGNRRYFTIASSPTETELHLGVRFYPKSSTFKQALYRIDNRSKILAGQIAGDFTLPPDPRQKLVFIAGGIGITPFRSMLKYLIG